MIEGKGYVEPADIPYNSPIVGVAKKDESQKLCVDYRRLNAVTVSEHMSQLTLRDALKNIGKAKLFTSSGSPAWLLTS